MTNGSLEPPYPIDASPESLRRTLDLARRALHVQGALIVGPVALDNPAFEHESTLAADIAPDEVPVARLLVRDAPDRQWSDDDRAMLRDLADALAEEIRLTDRIASLEAERSPLTAASPDVALNDAPTTDTSTPAVASLLDADIDPSSDPGALCILLADDLDLNRKLICDMLSLDGYIVDSVADGAAAVDAVKGKPYDLVLMDMIMPGMDGMDATRAIRALPAPACDVPIVALTAHSFQEQLDNCIHAGMNATLTKPMSFDALSNAVSTWARSRQAA